MEHCKILEKLTNIILKDKGDIIFIAIIILVLAVGCIQAIYTSSIEEIFMAEKNKFKNAILKLVFFWMILIPKNLFLAMYDVYILLAIVLCLIFAVVYMLFKRNEKKVKSDNVAGCKLKRYYKEIQSEMFLRLVMYGMPIVPILLRDIRHDSSLLISSIITSVLEVAIISVSMPELIIRKSMDYYKDGTDKVFLYKSLENNNYLCGDSENISLASRYKIISLEELKNKEIYHQKYKKLTKAERKELDKLLKK